MGCRHVTESVDMHGVLLPGRWVAGVVEEVVVVAGAGAGTRVPRVCRQGWRLGSARAYQPHGCLPASADGGRGPLILAVLRRRRLDRANRRQGAGWPRSQSLACQHADKPEKGLASQRARGPASQPTHSPTRRHDNLPTRQLASPLDDQRQLTNTPNKDTEKGKGNSSDIPEGKA